MDHFYGNQDALDLLKLRHGSTFANPEYCRTIIDHNSQYDSCWDAFPGITDDSYFTIILNDCHDCIAKAIC